MGIALLAPILFLAVVDGQTVFPGDSGGLKRYCSGNGGYANQCKINNCDLSTDKCKPGQYLSGCGGVTSGSCPPCTNTKPPNSFWKSNGQYSPTGCFWECDVNYKKVGDACVLQLCADQNKPAVQYSDFLPGSEGQVPNCKYQCNPWYYGTTPPGERWPAPCRPCDAGTFSNTAGSTTCSNCGPGLYSSSQGSIACSTCLVADRKYSTAAQNQACTDCTLCGNGFYKTNCGGKEGPGTCTNCNNTLWS
jgi:hypothetical protein